jgi:hypothetical protein
LAREEMNMRKLLAVITLLCASVSLDLAMTPSPPSYIEGFPSKRPPMELSDALTRATQALGPIAKNAYCVDAHLTTWWTGTNSQFVGKWFFMFGTTKDAMLYKVWVEFSGQTSTMRIRPDGTSPDVAEPESDRGAGQGRK